MEKVLEIIKRELDALGIDYYYMINTASTVKYPYVTGEYNESEYSYEDNSNVAEMLLEVWNRDSDVELVKLNDLIKNHFRNLIVCEEGLTVHISYANSFPVRTGDYKLKKREIHLDINFWEGEQNA